MRTQLNLMNLARRQRWMLWLVLATLLMQILPMGMVLSPLGTTQTQELLFMVLGIAQLTVYALAIVGVVLLLIARGSNIILIVLLGILMIAPCGNLIVLLYVNMSATRELRRAGIRVGFMGASLDEVERIVDPALCDHCGYNLTGNVSGICPECGTAIPPPEVTTVPAVPPTAPTT